MKNIFVFIFVFFIVFIPNKVYAEDKVHWKVDSSLWSGEVISEVKPTIGEGEYEGVYFLTGRVTSDVLFVCANKEIDSPIRSVVEWEATPVNESVSNQWYVNVNISYETDNMDYELPHVKHCFDEAMSVLKPKEISVITENLSESKVNQFTVETEVGVYDLFIPLNKIF